MNGIVGASKISLFGSVEKKNPTLVIKNLNAYCGSLVANLEANVTLTPVGGVFGKA